MIESTGIIECGGAKHRGGTEGHDGKLAAYIVHAHCPQCGWAEDVPMCAGRIERVRRDDGDFTHGKCGATMHWDQMWTLEPIRQHDVVVSPIVLSDVVAPSADVVAAYAEYLASRGRAHGTITLRLRYLAKVQDAFPDLTNVDPARLDAWIRSASRDWMPATTNSLIKSVRGLYAWADRFDVIRPNPATLIDIVPNPHRMGRIADDDKIRAALRSADPRLKAMLLLGRQCGLRVSEIAGLHTDNRAGMWLTIVGKGSKQRRVPLVQSVAEALDAIAPTGGGYYFHGGRGHRDEPMQGASVGKIISRSTGINAHSLRHAAATSAYAASKDLRSVQDFLGHANTATTSVYVHTTDESVQGVADAGAMRLEDNES